MAGYKAVNLSMWVQFSLSTPEVWFYGGVTVSTGKFNKSKRVVVAKPTLKMAT